MNPLGMAGFRLSLFLFLTSLFVACVDASKSDKDVKPYTGPVIKTFHLNTVYTDSAKVRIKMYADLQLEYQNGNQEYPKGVKLEFFNELGQNHAVLTAKKGKFDKQKNEYTAYKDVVVRNLLKNEQLNTDELHWTPNTQKIYTDKGVTITTSKEILKGLGLSAKQDFTEYEILRPTGQFTVQK